MIKFRKFLALKETDCPQDEYGKRIAAHDIKPIKPIEPKRLKVSTQPIKPRSQNTFREFSRLYAEGMKLELSEQEFNNVVARTLQKLKRLKPIIRIGVNRTKVTDHRTNKTYYAKPAKKQYGPTTKENVEMSKNSLMEMLTKKAAATAERKRREDESTNRFFNTNAVAAYNEEKAARSAIAAAAVKKTLEAFNEKAGSRPANTPASATLRDKPNVQKSNAADVVKQHVININLDLPSPEKLGYGHQPTQTPAVRQRTPSYRFPGIKNTAPVASGEKQQSPRKPAGDTGSNIESRRGYY
jgi:hypothetical protein